jgi:hypothetical protein
VEVIELEDIANETYRTFGFDPGSPPGPLRLAVFMWGAANFRYVAAPRPDVELIAGGWILELPLLAQSTTMTMGIARAIARETARRLGESLTGEEIESFAEALALPIATLRHECSVLGRNANEIALLFNVPLDVAILRVRRLIDHGSGERPSASDNPIHPV